MNDFIEDDGIDFLIDDHTYCQHRTIEIQREGGKKFLAIQGLSFTQKQTIILIPNSTSSTSSRYLITNENRI